MEESLSLDEQADTLLAVDEALTRLHSIDERLAQVVEYRFLGADRRTDSSNSERHRSHSAARLGEGQRLALPGAEYFRAKSGMIGRIAAP